MIKPSLNKILKDERDYYSLVLAIAKRAREIGTMATESGEILKEKPVETATREFIQGKINIAN